MSDELKTNLPRVDGFDDDDAAEGDFVRVIQGEKWTFTNECIWVDADENEIQHDRAFVAVDICRVLQKWIDKMPVETRFLASGEKVDLDQLNDACPKSEFREDLSGKLKGPWQIQHVVYLVDMATMRKFTYPTDTTGGRLAVGDLKEAVRLQRRFKGPGYYPVVSVGTKHMNTKFGGRPRPHFIIRSWISFGPDGTAALPAASPPSLPGPAKDNPIPAERPRKDDPISTGRPRRNSDMDDDIPFFMEWRC
jgi:hypothetical protein